MISRVRAVLELLFAGAAIVGCAVSWSHAHSTVPVAPVADGEPTTWSVVYHPLLVLLTLVLATLAGVLVVVGAARVRRGLALR